MLVLAAAVAAAGESTGAALTDAHLREAALVF
jgi:hypothetical protein